MDIHLPLQEPLQIFTLVLLIILLIPALFKRIRIPEIIGLILAGVLVGSNGLNLLSEDIGISIFSEVGLLYLMFLAGLEINLNDFQKNRNKSFTLGALTFFLPFVVSFVVVFYLLDFNFLASLLIGGMMATQTLVAYPIVSRLGISKNRVVNISIGATIIADTLALLILAFISESAQGELNWYFWLKFLLYFAVFVFIVNWIFPRLSRWFFKHHDGESSSEYIFVLAVVFVSAVIAEFAHVEPIIGAFFAGLALNRLIPQSSPLMNRIVFIGHTIFIPFFLISVGMLVDLEVLFHSWEMAWTILILVIIAIITKYAGAYIVQKIYGYSVPERHLIFGLSNARAASAIAIIIVGYNLGVVHETIMNATILLVLVTSLLSSFVTQNAGIKIALKQDGKRPEEKKEITEKILVAISKPENVEKLMHFAAIMKDKNNDNPLYPISIVPDDNDSSKNVLHYNNILDQAKEHASEAGIEAKSISRVDTNVADGLNRAAKEFLATRIIMGWHEKTSPFDIFFGTLLENLLLKTGVPVYVVKLNKPLKLVKNIHVFIPPYAEHETGFEDWLNSVAKLSLQTDSHVNFWGYPSTTEKIKQKLLEEKFSGETTYRTAKCPDMLKIISRKLEENDLLIIISARKNTLSYNKHIRQLPGHLASYFNKRNVMVVYPKQDTYYTDSINIQL